MDKVIIRELRIDTIVGLYPWERVAKQTLWLDIELATDVQAAAASDDLQYTIDYAAVCQQVCEFVQHGQFKLIETLAEKVGQMIHEKFQVTWLKMSVNKIDVLTNVRSVGIEIERSYHKAN